MATAGTIRSRNGALYVLHEYNEFSEPFRQYQWWRIIDLRRNAYTAATPEDGDAVTYTGDGVWSGGARGSVVTATNFDAVERVSVNPPPARGKDLRWNDGRWERLLVRGWVPAQ